MPRRIGPDAADKRNLTFRQFAQFPEDRRISVNMNYSGRRALNEDEVDCMLQAFQGRYSQRDRALFLLGVHTGYRISEILSLRVRDVWIAGEVVQSVTVAKGFTKGKHQSRTMPLHDRARQALQLWIISAKLENPLSAGKPVFFRQGSKKPITRNLANTILHRAAVNAGINPRRIGTHSMRKTFASRMWRSPYIGGDMAKMARLLGHQNYSNTLRYLEFLDGSIEQAVLA